MSSFQLTNAIELTHNHASEEARRTEVVSKTRGRDSELHRKRNYSEHSARLRGREPRGTRHAGPCCAKWRSSHEERLRVAGGKHCVAAHAVDREGGQRRRVGVGTAYAIERRQRARRAAAAQHRRRKRRRVERQLRQLLRRGLRAEDDAPTAVGVMGASRSERLLPLLSVRASEARPRRCSSGCALGICICSVLRRSISGASGSKVSRMETK